MTESSLFLLVISNPRFNVAADYDLDTGSCRLVQDEPWRDVMMVLLAMDKVSTGMDVSERMPSWSITWKTQESGACDNERLNATENVIKTTTKTG